MDATPEIHDLARPLGLSEWIGSATLAVARRLAGEPTGDPGPLGALWFSLADGELRLLEIACGGEPLRAAMCAVAWVTQILRHLGTRAKVAVPSREQGRRVEDEEFSEFPDEALLREQLALLMQRRVPEGFPMPHTNCSADGGPLALGAALRGDLGIGSATRAALATARTVDEALLTLGLLAPGLGWDLSTGRLHRTLLTRLQRLSMLLGKLPTLRRVAEELGRLEAHERITRRTEQGGRESVVGVRMGGELSDALTAELSLLSTEETEYIFYQRLIERRLVCLELLGTTTEHSKVEQKRGPAIACVDTSGSMQGAPEVVAKALILAVVRQLVPRGRSVQLLLFGGPGESTPLEIQQGQAGLAQLLDFLSMGFHAGTDYDTPLLRALELLKTDAYARADVLVVTDGLCRASRGVTAKVAHAKQQAGARVLSVVVGGDTAGVEDFSDQVWVVDPRSPVDGGLDLQRWCRAGLRHS